VITDAEFTQTNAYAVLCYEFALDPDVPLDTQTLGVIGARDFWTAYEIRKRDISPRTVTDVTGALLDLISASTPVDPGEVPALRLVTRDRHNRLVLETPDGQRWQCLVKAEATAENPATGGGTHRHARGLLSRYR
jgi:hypothetical protein